MPKQIDGETVYTLDEADQILRQDATECVERGIRTGGEFKLVRKFAELSQGELAGLLGVTLESVSRWETGKHEIPRAVAYALGELLRHPKAVRRQLEAAGQPLAAKR
ncbi:MAG: helix-turn-helix domain-containing protein [Actinobacteria bacterium]|nr:helix-turn-helix domain-containing protein [Actinomycetota bacterium]